MSKFKPATQYEPEPVELSPSRAKLAEMIAERDAAMAAARVESERSNKLAIVHDAVEPARAALADFDHQTAVAMSNWAASNVTGLPKGDAARRAQLVAALDDAQLAGAAAKSAQDACQREVERISASLTPLAFQIGKLARIVAVEEASELLPQIAAAIATADSLRLQLVAAREEAGANIPFG